MKKLFIKHIFFALVLVILCAEAQSQTLRRNRGFSPVKNYTPKEYGMHERNFQSIRNRDGIMFFANFGGVAAFDGNKWQKIFTKSGLRVVSLAIPEIDNNKIFVGGLNDFGYIIEDKNRTFSYISLKEKTSTGKEVLGEIFKVIAFNEKVFYFTEKLIYIYNNKALSEIPLQGNLTNAFTLGGEIYCFFDPANEIQTELKGLKKMENGTFSPVSNSSETNILDIADIVPFQNKAYIFTKQQGVFILENNDLKVASFQSNNFFAKTGITCAVYSGPDNFYIGTPDAGIFATDISGNILYNINRESRLNDNYIGSLYIDTNKRLWATTHKGISSIAVNYNFTLFENTHFFDEASVYKSLPFNEDILFASEKGLFQISNNQMKRVSKINTAFTDIAKSGKNVVLSSASGLYFGEPNALRCIDSTEFVFTIIKSRFTPDLFIAGKTDKISLYQIDKNKISKIRDIPGFQGEIRKIIELSESEFVLESAPDKIFYYSQTTNKIEKAQNTEQFTTIHANLLADKTFYATDKGIFRYENNTFVPENPIEKDTTLRKTWIYDYFPISSQFDLITDGEQKNPCFVNFESSKITLDNAPLLPFFDYTIYHAHYESDKNLLWLTGKEGAILYNTGMQNAIQPIFKTRLSEIKLIERDSILSLSDSSGAEISYADNSLRFEFTLPSFPAMGNNTYRFKLEGYDKEFSPWAQQTHKDYTNLPDGSYSFLVESRNEFGLAAVPAKFDFKILTPIYRRWWALLVYAAIIVFVVRFFVRYRLKKLENERLQLEMIVKERTEEIENQKEELRAQADELEMSNEELEKIDAIVKTVNREIEFTVLLQTFLSKISEMTAADRASALVFNKSTGFFDIQAVVGDSIENYVDFKPNLSDVKRRYFDNGDEIFENVFYKKNINPQLLHNPSNLQTPRSMLSIVVGSENEPAGLLVLSHFTNPDHFKARHLRMAKSLKEHITSAFLKAGILQDLKKAMENLKETQAELIRKEKLASIGSLTKGIVDRIINPLNYINNFSQISRELTDEILNQVSDSAIDAELKADIQDSGNMVRHNLEKIHFHGTNTARIVKAMEKLLKEKSNTFVETNILALVKTNVDTTITEFKKKYPQAAVPKIQLDILPDIEIPILPEEMSDVIKLIVDNACSALKNSAQPTIQISANLAGNDFLLKIRDNGQGIPEKEIDKIFDPFFTTKPTSEGSGLGLYMCKEVVEFHGGTISAYSKVDNFTEIIIQIPRKKN